ncbi:PDGLE domain-containing protein [Streptomyces sp. NPDC000941]
MSALGRVVRSGVRRRRVQNAVIGLATTMAVTAAVLCASLLVASSAPFADAFAKQRGAHLSVRYDAARATAAQLAGSADARGVTAAAGPFPTASATPSLDGEKLVPMSVVGRADPGRDPVDRVTLTQGVWATRPGQIVLSAEAGVPPEPGLRLSFPDLPGEPTLTVVGVARSVSRTADAWVAPSQIASLTAPGARAGYQMLYRFADADTGARIAAGRAAVTAAAPAGARVGDQSWLAVKREAEQETAVFVPFLVAFGVLGLVMAVLIVGNVVAGAVGGGLRRIGVLKALGFTPAQVVRAYMAQALIPAAFGTVVGVIGGTLLTRPVLSEAEEAYGTAGLIIAPWVVVAVAAGALGLVAVTAPAARRSARRVWAIGVAAALLCAGVVSFYASASPDGLEKVAHDNGIDKKTEDHAGKDSPLADYGVKDISDARLSGGLAGVIGVGATLAVGSGLFIVVRRRAKKAAAGPAAVPSAHPSETV